LSPACGRREKGIDTMDERSMALDALKLGRPAFERKTHT